MKFRSIKGTKDILPEESHRWQAAEDAIRTVMHAFNYREIRTPVFEETALFTRGIGELTDIVAKEMYTFEDRSGTSVTLRPEMTASVIRSYIQNNLGEQQPLVKVFYIGPMFRQERPQAGRLRQFHQFGAEAIGGSGAELDAEIIALSTEIYRTVGVGKYTVKVNSVGCENCRPAYKTRLQEYLKGVKGELSEESRRRFEQNPLRILDSKDENDRKLTRDAPLMMDNLCRECSAHFSDLRRLLTAYSVGFEIDGRIVRGLDYYTKTAYEVVSPDLGSQDALAGGGRYDLLVKELDGKPTGAVGFAAGMERLLMALERHEKMPDAPGPIIFLAAADDEGRQWALARTMALRRNGVPAETDLLGRSLKAQMREADRQKARFVMIIGGKELASKEAVLKDMRSGEGRTVALDRLEEALGGPR